MTLEELAKQKIIECAKNLKEAGIDWTDLCTSMTYYVIAMNDLKALSDDDTYTLIDYYSCYNTALLEEKKKILPEWFVLE